MDRALPETSIANVPHAWRRWQDHGHCWIRGKNGSFAQREQRNVARSKRGCTRRTRCFAALFVPAVLGITRSLGSFRVCSPRTSAAAAEHGHRGGFGERYTIALRHLSAPTPLANPEVGEPLLPEVITEMRKWRLHHF